MTEHNQQDKNINKDAQDDISFFDKPKNIKLIINGFYVICAILVLLDFVVHRHIYLDFEKIPAFYAIYGFVACVVLVVLAKLMRIGLMRDEEYYDKNEGVLANSEQPSKDEEVA